ncbi:MAG: mechanosensitive ion channel [Chloroflexi bacterium]|nr:mechanosensitive ion channel [Chloroflexota bacterium]
MNETVTTWGDAVMLSVTEALQNFLGFLPALVGAILVLVLGWIISGLLAGLIERVLKTLGFEHAANSTGINDFIKRGGSEWSASRIVAEIVKWFIRLVAIQAAAQILGMERISEIITAILLWLPNLVVALAIIVIGALIANFVSGIVRASTSEMGLGNPNLLAGIARYAIIVFAVVAAVDQLGIAETVVNTLFVMTVGAVALAFGLAFGLGGQNVAAQMTQRWYTKGQEASQKIAHYAEEQQAPDASSAPAADAPASPQPRPPADPEGPTTA